MEPTDEAVEAMARFLYGEWVTRSELECARDALTAYLATPEAQAMARDAARWRMNQELLADVYYSARDNQIRVDAAIKAQGES